MSWRCFSSSAPPEKNNEEDNDIFPERRLKFSAFARKERDYSIDKAEEIKKRDTFVEKPLEIKPEYSRIPFDPNTRHQLDEIPNKVIYEGIALKHREEEPQSMYAAVEH